MAWALVREKTEGLPATYLVVEILRENKRHAIVRSPAGYEWREPLSRVSWRFDSEEAAKAQGRELEARPHARPA